MPAKPWRPKLWTPELPAVYYRASTETQEELQTIKTQRHFVRRHLEMLGFDPEQVPEYLDDGVTGTISIFQRDAGRRLMADAQRGRFKTLYVYAVDRLGREALWVLEAEHHLRAAHIKLQSATQTFDPADVTGAFLLTLLAGQAQMERSQIVGRLFNGASRCAEEGFWIGGRVPLGYRLEWVGKRQRLALCDLPFPGCESWSPVRLVRHVFQRCHADKATCHVIAKELSAWGVPTYWVPGSRYANTPQRSEWLPARVRALLTCETYSGVHTYGKSPCPKRAAQREPIRRECPAIVSPELFAACQPILTRNRNLTIRPRDRAYLLRGLIQCGHCGRNYCGSCRSHGTVSRFVYQCNGRVRYSPQMPFCRASHWVDCERLEEDLKAAIRHCIAHPGDALAELQAGLAGEQERAQTYQVEIRELDKQRAALGQQAEEYIRLRAAGLIKTDVQLGGFLGELDARMLALDTRAAELAAKVAGCRSEEVALQESELLLAELQSAAEHPFDEADWRRILEQWVVGITIHTEGEGKRKRARAEVLLRVGPAGFQATEKLTLWRQFFYGLSKSA